MRSILNFRTLEAAVARILPGQDPAPAPAADVVADLVSWLDAQPSTWNVVRAGLLLLQARDFALRPAGEQDAILAELEAHPSIATLIRLCVERYYTSSAGLAEVGFRVTA